MLYDFPIAGGGSGVYVKYLALRLQEQFGYKVGIALPDRMIVHNSIPQYNLALPQVPVFIGRPGLESSKKYCQLTTEEIAELYHAFITGSIAAVESFKPDIINVHHIMLGAWAARFLRSIYGVKIVLSSHGSCIHVIQKDRRYFKMSRDALRAANAITVVSGDTREKLLKTFGSDLSNKTRTITGGVRFSLFPPNKSPEKLRTIRELYDIKKDRVVLFTGRLIEEKGVDYLIRAAEHINGQIIIAGHGPQKEALQKIILKRGILNVRMLGYLKHEDLVNIYYTASVFVSPSVWDDPMPLTIIEAMASGLPVVVTRRGGIPLAVKDGWNGMFVRPRSVTDIVTTVNYLLDHPEKRNKLGSNARAIVEQKFTWTHIAGRFAKLFESLYM